MAISQPMVWLSNQKLSTRFRLILVTQIFALAIIIGAIVISVPEILNRLQQLGEAQNNLNITGQIEGDLLRSREHEQDFFLQSNLSLGASNINFIQYTNQIAKIQSTIDLLAIQNPSAAMQIEEGIDTYNNNFQEIVLTYIPERQQTIQSINTILNDMNEIVESQDNVLVISNVSNLKNNLIIYQLQLSPNRNSYDEFQITQLNLVGDIQETYQQLVNVLNDATITQSVQTELMRMASDIMSNFNELRAIDSTISERIRRFKSSVTSVSSIVSQLIVESDTTFQAASSSFIPLIQTRIIFLASAIITSTMIVIFLIPMIIRSIETPLHLLADATENIASGNYERRIDYEAKDELGQLAVSFNQMGDAIQQRNRLLNQALEEAHEANRLKDEFLATMSHELRTPLNAIIGFLGIISMTTTLDEKNAHRLERATVNSERLLGLINNILDISRIEAGRMKITKSAIQIRDLAEDIHSQLEILTEDKNVKFIIEVDDNLPEEILTDEDAITKIITNLSGNAMKFTEEGEVRVRIFADEDQQSWLIEVSDTGIGIPIHMQETIFDRFRQVDGSSTREYGGSGLGLAIVSGLCREMDGTVTVESDIGQGSTFYITLPLELPEATEIELD